MIGSLITKLVKFELHEKKVYMFFVDLLLSGKTHRVEHIQLANSILIALITCRAQLFLTWTGKEAEES